MDRIRPETAHRLTRLVACLGPEFREIFFDIWGVSKFDEITSKFGGLRNFHWEARNFAAFFMQKRPGSGMQPALLDVAAALVAGAPPHHPRLGAGGEDDLRHVVHLGRG